MNGIRQYVWLAEGLDFFTHHNSLDVHVGCCMQEWICSFLLLSSIASGEGNGTPLQYSCLENPMDGGAWQAAVHGVAKSWTRLSNFTSLFTFMLWRRKWQPTPVLLPGESRGRWSLVGCRLWGCTESDTTEVTQQQQQQQYCKIRCTTVRLTIHALKGILVVSSAGLLLKIAINIQVKFY